VVERWFGFAIDADSASGCGAGLKAASPSHRQKGYLNIRALSKIVRTSGRQAVMSFGR
jgi:hypothetical protein